MLYAHMTRGHARLEATQPRFLPFTRSETSLTFNPTKMIMFFLIIALSYLQSNTPVKAAPTLPGPSLLQPSLTLPFNLTNEPRIYCDRSPVKRTLPKESIRECKSAVAFLPLPFDDIHTFSPREPLPFYRTPISSTHSTRCEARVDLLGAFSSDKASWKEVREAAWDIIATCLEHKGRIGYARVGERYGIMVGIEYDFPDASEG